MNDIENPRISIIMVDGSFRESFHAIDFFGNQTIPANDYELIWVEYYDKINPELKEKISRYSNFRIITLKRMGEYHSSFCFNAGIVASRGKLLIMQDADVAVEKDFLERIWQEHQENDKLVMYCYRYEELKKDHLPEVDIEYLRKVCVLMYPSNYGGCLSVRKKWLLEINGYEQHPLFSSGYHSNGLDVYTRLKNLGLYVKWHPNLKLYHPWHSGTAEGSVAYQLQPMLIDYRARNLAVLTFRGIEPLRNVEPPADLIREVEAAKRKYEFERVYHNKGNLNRKVQNDTQKKQSLQRKIKHLTTVIRKVFAE